MGYRMPAEWERHDATWISWPKDPDTFPPSILRKVEAAFVKMVEALGAAEEVKILVDNEKAEAHISPLLKRGELFSFHRIKTVDVWTRDYLPTYVKGRDLAVVRWMFNAWGNKYQDLLPDNEAGDKVAESTGLVVFRPGVVMEGGGFDTDGEGTILATENVMLNPNRNPGLGKRGTEKIFADYLGGKRTVWLKKGIEGDDTDGHIDDLARFVGSKTVIAASERKKSDPNHDPLKENLAILSKSKDAGGKALEVIEIAMPDRVDSKDGRLPASHLNFYIGNRAVLVPTFGGDSDRKAMETIEEAFPSREVIGVDCRALVYGLGTIHCVTQQVPAI
jgi:agmatine deiminase